MSELLHNTKIYYRYRYIMCYRERIPLDQTGRFLHERDNIIMMKLFILIWIRFLHKEIISIL